MCGPAPAIHRLTYALSQKLKNSSIFFIFIFLLEGGGGGGLCAYVMSYDAHDHDQTCPIY